MNEARVQWEAGGLRVDVFKLLTRKVKYVVLGIPVYGKWKVGMWLHALNEAGHKEISDKIKGNIDGDFMKKMSICI